jgi:hypothetical protein
MGQGAPGTRQDGTFRELARRGGSPIPRVGCLLMLGAPVAGLGIMLVVASLFVWPHAETAVAQRGLGAAMAVVGLAVFVARLRRGRAAAGPRVDLALPTRSVLHPGDSVPLRIRVHGPCRFDRLTIKAVCDRHYQGSATPALDGPRPATDLVETVVEQEVFAASATTVERARPFERVVPLAISSLGRPTGPALPGGTIAWHLLASFDAGRFVDRFDIVVAGTDAEGRPVAPPPEAGGRRDATASAAHGRTALGAPSALAGLGCALFPLLFVLAGSGFLYLYFSGAQTRRGNPVVGLVYGTACVLVGLIGLYAAFTGRKGKGKKRKFSSHDARRLPK